MNHMGNIGNQDTIENLISLIDMTQLKNEIKCNPETKFREEDIDAIKRGDLDVILHVVELYAIGSDKITPNPNLALKMCKLCIDLGSANGYGLLADFYENGIGVEKDYHLSLMTLLEGAKKGSPLCMVRLANRNQRHRIRFDGYNIFGVEEECRWLKQAAELNYPLSYIPLGLRYQSGIGVEQNRDEAILWYNRAKEAGIETAMDYIIDIWRTNKD